MTSGRYHRLFAASLVLVLIALTAPWIGAWAAPFALAGLLGYEHAYVQSAQMVPLA
jgi:hypothetical protein